MEEIFKMMSKYLRARGKPRIKRVLIPSLSIIYPPYSKSRKRNFSVLFSFPVGQNKSQWRLFLTATFCEYKMQNANQHFQNSRFCHRITSTFPFHNRVYFSKKWKFIHQHINNKIRRLTLLILSSTQGFIFPDLGSTVAEQLICPYITFIRHRIDNTSTYSAISFILRKQHHTMHCIHHNIAYN